MAQNAVKAQKKKERRNKREKDKRKETMRLRSRSEFAILERIVAAEFLPCAMTADMEAHGMASVAVARQFESGLCVVAVFLVDILCLGIKDVIFEVTSRLGYEEILEGIGRAGAVEQLPPEDAKKLCLRAAAYAGNFGLKPHSDFAKAMGIFLGVDELKSEREFSFGKDGKPFYVCGPNDSRSFQERVVRTLHQSVGPGNYDAMIRDNYSDARPVFDELQD